MGIDADFVTGLILRLPVVLFSLTLHEFMHGWVALKCGDDTARRAGRLTFSPLAHLDPLGTICLILGPIGWAKPVPVNPYNFRRPRRDDILVSGAGIAANFTLGIVFALVLRFLAGPLTGLGRLGEITLDMVFIGALVNFGLAVFNLLPIPPLDGSHILQNLLPGSLAMRFGAMRPYGAILLLAFILGNQYAAKALGMSLLGYPILALLAFFAGTNT